MSQLAPGDFFKRKGDGGAHVRKLRRFSDVDSDSDLEVEDVHRASTHSRGSLSFQTEATAKALEERGAARARSVGSRNVETTSDGSIHFESGSDGESSHAQPQEAVQVRTQKREPPAPAKQTLAEQLFGHMEGFSVKPEPPRAVAHKEQPPPRAVVETRPVTKPAAAAVAAPPTAVHKEKRAPTPVESKPATRLVKVVSSAPPSAPAVVPLVVKPAQQALSASPALADTLGDAYDDEHDNHSDAGFADNILPVDTGARRAATEATTAATPQQPLFMTPLRDSVRANPHTSHVPHGGATLHDPSDELLVRARLRLEEKRKTEAAAATMGSRATTPRRYGASSPTSTTNGLRLAGGRGGATPLPPSAFYLSSLSSTGIGHRQPSMEAARPAVRTGYSPMRDRPSAFEGPESAAHMVEAKLRRLTQENSRLQDEMHFLGRENQKLRSVAGSSDSAESIKLQLTVDLLRKELQSKELEHQTALRDTDGEKVRLANQVAELQDQNDGYASTASQYKNLYEDKVREIEQLKMQFQRLSQDVAALEHKQHTDGHQYRGELSGEKEKVDKLVYLLEDVKRQRLDLHGLNQQLQVEIATLSDERTHAKEALASVEERSRQVAQAQEQVTATLQQDIVRLKDALAEKERGHASQLREEQRISASLQQRLDQTMAESRQEGDRLRRAAELAREDGKRAVTEEKELRTALEGKLRRVEEEFKLSCGTYRESMVTDLERRTKQLREDLSVERNAREVIQLERDRLADEVGRLQDAVAYHTEQYDGLSANFAHSEELRNRAEQQSRALSMTLQDMMHHDDSQSKQIAQLEGLVGDFRQQLGGMPFLPSAGTVPPGGSGGGFAVQMEQLSHENERLTNECVRLAGERDTLIDENGKIAEELLKWKNEMKQFVSAQLR